MNHSSKTITSAANPAVKRLKSLDQKKFRDAEGVFIVEGARHVGEAMAKGWRVETLAYSARAEGDPVVRASEKAGALCLHVSDDLLRRITGRDNTQPLIAVFRQHWQELKDVKEGVWAALEGIRDPGNLGTIVRTADAAGASGIILIGDTCDPWSPEAVRATMGSFACMKLARASAAEFRAWRKSWKGRIVGTHLKNANDYRKADYKPPLILMMGAESTGLSEEMAQLCDALVKIPMAGGAESLNLAVSTGIMLYEIGRNRL